MDMDRPDHSTEAQTADDPYTNEEAIKRLVKKRVDEWGKPRPRYPFLMAAERNIHYKHGNQWIVPLGGGVSSMGWRPVVNRKGGPLPVTNKFGSTMATFSSLLARFDPALHYRPATNDPDDQATADVASRVVEVCEDEVDIIPIRQMLAEWVTHTGGAWLEQGYDNDPRHGMVPVPMHACPECEATKPMEAAPMMNAAPMGESPMGMPGGPMPAEMMGLGPMCETCGVAMHEQNVPMPRGKMTTTVVSVFEMLFDPMVTDPTKHRGFVRIKSVDPDEAKQRWSAVKDRIAVDSTNSTRLTADALAQITPNIDDNTSQRLLTGGDGAGRVTEYWYWQMPDATYPEGLLTICLGRNQSLCVYKGPLPYYATRGDGSKDYFLPFVFFPQELVPGSAWPKTVANDVALKQKQRNQTEKHIEDMIHSMANHVWMIPIGANISTPITGLNGQVITWNSLSGNAEPKRVQGLPINGSLMTRLEAIDDDMQEISNIFDVLSGNRPAGVSAGITLQILKERGESRFGPMFILWNHAWAEWSRQMIEIFRMFATEERLLKIKGRDGRWEVQKFMAADLRGRVDVVPEAGASMPRSTMAQRAEMEQVVAAGAMNPAANIEDRIAFLEAFGLLHLAMPGMEKDTKRAFMENEQFEALGQHPQVVTLDPTRAVQLRMIVQQITQAAGPVAALQWLENSVFAGVPVPKVKPAIDDSAVHAREQRNFAKSERFDALPEVVQLLVEAHIAVHDFLTGQQMMAMQQARQGTTATAGFLAPPGPRPGSPPSTSPMRGGSSMARVDGDQVEAERRMARVG